MVREEICIHTIDYPFPHEYYKPYLMTETKIIMEPAGTQDNDI